MESKPDKLVPAVIGGAIIGILSSVPGLNFINCFCCAGIILGGFFAVFFYKKNLGEELPLTYSDGALLGILAGIFGVIISSILTAIIGPGIEQMLERALQYAEDIPPEAEDFLNSLIENRGNLMVLQIAFGLVINIVFGLLGGILGVAILAKKR